MTSSQRMTPTDSAKQKLLPRSTAISLRCQFRKNIAKTGHSIHSRGLGLATAQAVRHRLLNAKARVHSQSSPRGILYFGQSGIRRDLSPSPSSNIRTCKDLRFSHSLKIVVPFPDAVVQTHSSPHRDNKQLQSLRERDYWATNMHREMSFSTLHSH